MSNCIVEGGVAEIYLEDPAVVELSDEEDGPEDSDFEAELEQICEQNDDEANDVEIQPAQITPKALPARSETREEIEKQIQFVKKWYSPSKTGQGKEVVESSGQPSVHRRNGPPEAAGASATAPPEAVGSSANVPPQAMVVVSTTQQSSTMSKKRKATSGVSQSSDKIIKTSATARVHTSAGGNATLNLQANVPLSQASSSVTININSRRAVAKVYAQEPPRKKLSPRRPVPGAMLLLTPPPDQN